MKGKLWKKLLAVALTFAIVLGAVPAGALDGLFKGTVVEVLAAPANCFITDIMVYGGGKEAWENANSSYSGYSWDDYDLNAEAGGDYIYFGFKLTPSPNAADTVKNMILVKTYGKPKSSLYYDGAYYSLCPYDGSTEFVNSYGNLNRGTKGGQIHLYYTKTVTDKYAQSLYSADAVKDKTSSRDVNYCIQDDLTAVQENEHADFNVGAKGDYIYLNLFADYIDVWGDFDTDPTRTVTFSGGSRQLDLMPAFSGPSGVSYELSGVSGYPSSITQTDGKYVITKAGTYHLSYRLASTSAAYRASGWTNFVVTANKGDNPATIHITSIDFGETLEKTINSNYSTGAVRWYFSKDQNGTYTQDIPNHASKWYAYATIAADDRYNARTTPKTSFRINRASYGSTLTIADCYVGDQPQPAVSNNPGGGTVHVLYCLKGDDVYSDTIPAKAGTCKAYAQIESTADYNACTTPVITFNIKRHPIDPTPTVSVEDIYLGQSPNPTVSGYNGDGTPLYYYKSANGGNWSEDVPTTVGTYYAYAYFQQTDTFQEVETNAVSFEVLSPFDATETVFLENSNTLVLAGDVTRTVIYQAVPASVADDSLNVIVSGKGATLDMRNNDLFSDVRTKLKTVDLTGAVLKEGSQLNGLFLSCENLESVDLGGMDTSAVTCMQGMFMNCYALTSVDLSRIYTWDVTDFISMFSNCKKLETLDLTSFYMRRAADVSGMFELCESLKTIYVSTDWALAGNAEAVSMFGGCKSLKGGSGTAYSENANDKARACIDTNGTPGYLTGMYSLTFNTDMLSIDKNNSDAPVVSGRYPSGAAVELKYEFKKGLVKFDDKFFIGDVGGSFTVTFTDHDIVVDSFYDALVYDVKSKTLYVNGNDPDSITSNSLELYEENTEIIVVIGSMMGDFECFFQSFPNLKKADLTKANTSNMHTLKGMFSDSDLEEVDLSGIDTSSVKDMSEMFAHSYNIRRIDMSGLDTTSLEKADGMFKGCTKLRYLDLTGFNANSEVLGLEDCFKGVSDCEIYVTPGFDFTEDELSVLNPSLNFIRCYTLTLPKNMEIVQDADEEYRHGKFYLSGAEVRIKPRDGYDPVGGIMVNGLELLPEEDGTYLLSVQDCDLTATATVRNNMGLTDDDTLYLYGNIDRDEVRDFSGKNDVKKIVAVDAVFPAYCSGLFEDYKYVTEIDLSGADTSNVTDMSFMFYKCERLTFLDLSSFDTSNVTGMRSMFYGCRELGSLDLSSFDTLNVTNMKSMFCYSGSLQTLDLSNFRTPNVRDYSEMFNGCSMLQTLDLTGFEPTPQSIMIKMFESCTNLKAVYVSPRWHTDGCNTSYMFKGCTIEDVTVVYALSLPFGMEIKRDADAEQKALGRYLVGAKVIVGPTDDNCVYDILTNAQCETTADGNYALSFTDLGDDVWVTANVRPKDEFGSKVIGTSLTLDGAIGINVFVAESESESLSYVEFGYPDGTVKRVDKEDCIEQYEISGTPCLRFRADVCAKQMTDLIRVTCCDDRNGTAVAGQEFWFSVKDYADYILAHPENSEYRKAAELVRAMLNYGAYAQKYFGCNTDDLANSGLSAAQKTLGEDSEYEFMSSRLFDPGSAVMGNDIKVVTASLSLESRIAVNLYLSIDTDEDLSIPEFFDAKVLPNGLTRLTRTVDSPEELLDCLDFFIERPDVGPDYWAYYYPCDYLYRAIFLGKDAALKDLCKALVDYAAAYRNYSQEHPADDD